MYFNIKLHLSFKVKHYSIVNNTSFSTSIYHSIIHLAIYVFALYVNLYNASQRKRNYFIKGKQALIPIEIGFNNR
jgi:hypothetical protein